MTKIKKFFLTLSVISVLVVPYTSFNVSAVDYNLKFNISEPIVDNWTGYIIMPRSDFGDSDYYADLFFWVITPLGDYSLSFPTVNYFYNISSSSLQFTSSASDESYFVTVYTTSTSSTSTGNTVVVKDSFVINSTTDKTISLSLGSFDTFWRPQFKNVSSANETFPTSSKSYTVTWGDDLAVYDEIIQANYKLTVLINSLDLTNEQLEETYSLLSDYLNKLYLVDVSIEATLTWLYEEFYAWSFEVTNNHGRIIQLLEELVNGTVEYEEPTISPEQDDFNSIEDELINHENASNAQQDINIEINESAMSYIWDLVTTFINSNPKVFGLFISILSLGIIALILNR